MELKDNYRRLCRMLLAATGLISGCSSLHRPLDCHYQPVNGSVVADVIASPQTVRFTPDSAPDSEWFKRYRIDSNRLEAHLHHRNEQLQTGSRYPAIVNIRTSGRKCTPYVVYILK